MECLLRLVMGCFLFKQKTAYEMRISDWSSDVCSSDLAAQNRGELLYKNICAWVTDNFVNPEMTSELVADHFHISSRYIQNLFAKYGGEIGRASCRERVCQYV